MKELDCPRDYNSACCHDIALGFLISPQLNNFKTHGVIFESVPEGLALYGSYPLLDGNCCTIFSDRNLRPGPCFSVTSRDATCLAARRRDGNTDE